MPQKPHKKGTIVSGHVEIEGTVISSTKGIYHVELEQDNEDGSPMVIICTIAGKLRQNKIKILVGDEVKVKVSPYNLQRGFIFFRKKKTKKENRY